jgi:hypothetical protein
MCVSPLAQYASSLYTFGGDKTLDKTNEDDWFSATSALGSDSKFRCASCQHNIDLGSLLSIIIHVFVPPGYWMPLHIRHN